MKNYNDFTKTESRRICLFLLNMAVLAGVAVGAVITAKSGTDFLTGKEWLHQYFSPVLSGNTVLDVFTNDFFSSSIVIAAAFICGLFSCGQPAAASLLVYRGIGIGASSAHIYMLMGVKGLLPAAALLLPKALVISYITALGVREALKLSCIQFSFLFKDKLPEEKMQRTVKLYCIKFIVLIALMLIVSVIDSAFNYLLMDVYQT